MVSNDSINISSAGLVKYDGAGTFSGVTVTQFGTLIGAASNGITSSATGSSTQVLTSNGVSSDPTYQAAPAAKSFSINVQKFQGAQSTTYTPTAGTQWVLVRAIGAGGGGGCPSSTTANLFKIGAGGGGGSYCEAIFSIATIGASQSVSVGTGGLGHVPGGTGSTGGQTLFGSLITCNGGLGGAIMTTGTNPACMNGAAGAAAGTGGYLNAAGTSGGPGYAFFDGTNAWAFTSAGAPSIFGRGGFTNDNGGTGALTGFNGTGWGSGSAGSASVGISAGGSSKQAMDGAIYVIEYIFS